MLKNYFKTAWRNLRKNKQYTFINIAGLTLGISCSLIIFLIIRFEFSFDRYQPEAKRTYRVVLNYHDYGKIRHLSGVPYPLIKAFKNDFSSQISHISMVNVNDSPDIVSVKQPNGTISKFSLSKNEKGRSAMVSPDYFDIFAYKWISGNPDEALKQPNTVVISSRLARLFFGDENPMGKTLTLDNNRVAEITGVVKDPPANTDLSFNLLEHSIIGKQDRDNWHHISSDVQCYFVLKKGVNIATVKKGLKPFVKKYFGYDADIAELYLQPLHDLHFDTRFENLRYREVSKSQLWGLGLIGLVILIIACINFINLNTAVAVTRAKEVGVRKVLGSSRFQLVFHFLGETAFITSISMMLSLMMVEIATGHLKPLLGYNLSGELFADSIPLIYVVLTGIFVTLAAGLYPALKLSGFAPVKGMKGTVISGHSRGVSLRKGLIVTQFAISQVLMVAALVIWSQLHFMSNKNMGFDKNAVIEVMLPSHQTTRLETMRSRLLNHSEIKDVSFSNTGTASTSITGSNYKFYDTDAVKEGNIQYKYIDRHFMRTYGLTLLAGTMPHNTMSDSVSGYVVNQAFVKEVGHEKAYARVMGKTLDIHGDRVPIVGVVKNFNTQSLREKVKPVAMMIQNDYRMAAIKIAGGHPQQAIRDIKEAWEQAYPDYVFDYSFLDKTIAQFYEQEQKTAALITIFTIMAILIDCLGLFGMISYMAAARTKEVGVRKVLGASVGSILKLFSNEIILLVGIAFIAAVPIAWYLMEKWLSNFAYKINVGVSLFLIAFALSLLIALATVGWQSIKAALANPVDSLRSE